MIGGGSLVSRSPDGDKYCHRCILCLRIREEFFFQKNNTIWYSFYSKSLAILKKYKFSVSKKTYFFERNPSFERFGKSYYFSRFFWQKWYTLGKTWTQLANIGENTLVWVLWEAAVMYLFIQFIKLAWRIWNCFSIFEILLLSFFKVVFRERYWLYWGQPVCFPIPTK